MELELKAQALSLLCAAATGAGLSLVYELLRLFPGHEGRLRLFLSDLIFCLAVFAAAFLLGLSVCNGRLGLWEGLMMALGFLGFSKLIAFTKKACKKRLKFLKFFFPKVQ